MVFLQQTHSRTTLIEATISFWALPDHVALKVNLNEKSPAGQRQSS
jgi:hypothetical protein